MKSISVFVLLLAFVSVPEVVCAKQKGFWQSVFDWMDGDSSSSQSTTHHSSSSWEDDFYDAIAGLFGLDYDSSSDEDHRPAGSHTKPQKPISHATHNSWQNQQKPQYPALFPPGIYYGQTFPALQNQQQQQPIPPWYPPYVKPIPNAPPPADLSSLPLSNSAAHPTAIVLSSPTESPTSQRAATAHKPSPQTPATTAAPTTTTKTTTAAPETTTTIKTTTAAPETTTTAKTTTAAPANTTTTTTTTAAPANSTKNATTTAAPANTTTTAAPAASG